MNTKYSNLFESLTFKNGITIKNSVVMAPMTTWSSNDDYTISDEEVNYYKKRVNGVGCYNWLYACATKRYRFYA